MEKKLFSVAFGPISEGKPAKVDILVAESFTQVVEFCNEELLLSIQLLPDKPIIVNV